jgi:hypothetical protein
MNVVMTNPRILPEELVKEALSAVVDVHMDVVEVTGWAFSQPVHDEVAEGIFRFEGCLDGTMDKSAVWYDVVKETIAALKQFQCEMEEEETPRLFVTDHQAWLVREAIDKVYAIKLMMDTLIAEAKDIAQANA